MFTLESVKSYLTKDLDLKEDDVFNNIGNGIKNTLNKATNFTKNILSNDKAKTYTNNSNNGSDTDTDTVDDAKNNNDKSDSSVDNDNKNNKIKPLKWSFSSQNLMLACYDKVNEYDTLTSSENPSRVYYVFNYLDEEKELPVAKVRYAEIIVPNKEQLDKSKKSKENKDYWTKVGKKLTGNAAKLVGTLAMAQLGGFSVVGSSAIADYVDYRIGKDNKSKLKDKNGKDDKIATDENYNVIEFPNFKKFKDHALYVNNVPANLVQDFENRILELKGEKPVAKNNQENIQDLVNSAKDFYDKADKKINKASKEQ